jgi:hypothetical protein
MDEVEVWHHRYLQVSVEPLRYGFVLTTVADETGVIVMGRSAVTSAWVYSIMVSGLAARSTAAKLNK